MKRCRQAVVALLVASFLALTGCGDKKDGGGTSGPGPTGGGSKGGPPGGKSEAAK